MLNTAQAVESTKPDQALIYTVLLHCLGALSWCTVLVHCLGALSWCTVLVHCLGALSWCTVLVHCLGALSWCTVLAHSLGTQSWPVQSAVIRSCPMKIRNDAIFLLSLKVRAWFR